MLFKSSIAGGSRKFANYQNVHLSSKMLFMFSPYKVGECVSKQHLHIQQTQSTLKDLKLFFLPPNKFKLSIAQNAAVWCWPGCVQWVNQSYFNENSFLMQLKMRRMTAVRLKFNSKSAGRKSKMMS